MMRVAAIFVGTLLLATAGTAEEPWPSVEWTAPEPEVQGFVVERRTPKAAKRALVARLGPEARRFEDRSAPIDVAQLCYVVRAILRDGRWSPSEERCVQTGAPQETPSGPVVAVEVVAVDPTADEGDRGEKTVDLAEPVPVEPVDVVVPPTSPVDVAAPPPPAPVDLAAPPPPAPVDVAADPDEAPVTPTVERPRISDRFDPVPAERFLDRLDVGPAARPADEDEPLR